MPSGSTPRARSLRGGARVLLGPGLGMAVGILCLLLREARVVQDIEGGLLDLRTRWQAGGQPPDPRIVLMQVHESDVEVVLADLAVSWPWTLDQNGAIASVLADAGVLALLVDIYHLDQGAGPDDAVFRRPPSPAALQVREGEAGLAEEYGAVLARLERTALAYSLTDDPRYATLPRVAAAEEKLEVPGLRPVVGAPRRASAEFPVRRVTAGVKRLGFGNVRYDAGGVVRRATPLGWLGKRPVASLALAGALLVAPVETRASDGALLVSGREVPLDDDGALLLDFRTPPGGQPYARVSPAQVIAWGVEKARSNVLPDEARAALAGKIVIWGVNLPGSEDVLPTPVAARLDGPELQATILDNLLNGGSRVLAGDAANLAFLLGVALLVGVLSMLPRGKVLPHLLALATLVLATLVAFQVFASGVALDLFAPLLAGLLTWLAVTAARLLTEGRYNRWLEGTFSRYLAPSVIEALKGDPKLLELGGRTCEISVLFSDVAGFTGLSERLQPPQVVELLNRYLSGHCEAVFAEDGVVDKFIGDAVMAFWGDPVPQADHALRACRTALAVQAALPALEPVWRGMGLPEFHVRVGLNAGPAVVGNMGSRQRFDYTAMGDTVNLASRLEGANKAFGTSILIGDTLRRMAGADVLTKPLARLTVVGRGEPVLVHELVALTADASPALQRHVAAFTRAVEAAGRGDLSAARSAWAQAERERPGDGACAWLARLLERLERGQEPSPWSGVVVLTGK